MSMQVAFQPSNCLPMTLEGCKARAWKGRAPACLPMPGGYGGLDGRHSLPAAQLPGGVPMGAGLHHSQAHQTARAAWPAQSTPPRRCRRRTRTGLQGQFFGISGHGGFAGRAAQSFHNGSKRINL
jgi:hypothetical protein